jgi:predicted O-methyltransferase YrrM
MDWGYIEKKYEDNVVSFLNKKLFKYKGTSDSFFESNNKYFDFIYIDGHHEEEYVQRDATNSLSFLKDGGVIAFDDCGGLEHIKNIAEDLAQKNNLEITTNNWQIWMRKL